MPPPPREPQSLREPFDHVLPPKHPDEEARLAALRRYEILDTEYEQAFDDLTRLAAELCDAPIAVINLIDRDRQWFKSHVGLAVRETPLDVSICAHALLQPDVFVVPDTLDDERFAQNPLVTGEPHLRFYAGALLESSDGQPVGTLCVLDYAPRAAFTERQKNVLRVLAREVTSQMELRRALRRQEAVERELRASEERFRAVQETSPDGFMVFETVRDADGTVVDFRWAYCNPAAAKIVGRPREWFVGRRLLEEMPGNREEGLFDAYVGVVETGVPWTREFGYAHEGVQAYLRATASKAADGFAVSFADLSERRRAEEALIESEARFRNMADHAPVMVWVTESDGTCTYLSQSWYEFTGQTPETALGMGWLDAVHADDQAEAAETFLAATGRREGFRLDYRLRRRDGVYRWAIDSARPRIGADGEFLGFIGSVIDITERKEAERRERFVSGLAERTRGADQADPDEVQWETVRELGVFLEASGCVLVDVDEESGTLFARRDWTRPGGASAAGRYPAAGFGEDGLAVLRGGNPLVIGDVAEDAGVPVASRATYAALGIGSLVSVPIHRGGKWVGLLGVHDAGPRAWSAEEVALVAAVAERVWLARENARLAREREEAARKNERIAETLQRSLLIAPDPARLPKGLDLGTEYLAAWDEALIGGDFFDAFALRGGGRLALVVGDATGKGLEAAEHIAEVKYALRAFLREDPDPAAALGRLNRFACDGQALAPSSGAYLAVAVAVLDPETGRGVCAAAGMEPPLVLRSGGVDEEVAVGGPLVGVEEAVAYEAVSFALEPGDLLALATDGITEARAAGDRRSFFGPEGLAGALRAEDAPGRPLAEVARAAVARAVAYADGRRADDMCLLVARRRP